MQTVADEARIYKLWYDEPAQVWTEALPLGNGRLGAMVYGTPAMENIQLNEETLWAGRPNNNANPNAMEYIPKVRQLVFEGKYLEAQTLATEKVMAKPIAVCLISHLDICVLLFPVTPATPTTIVNLALIPPVQWYVIPLTECVTGARP